METKERQRGVYQVLSDLNYANKNIKELKAHLEKKDSELKSLKENLAAESVFIEQEKIHEYVKEIEHLNKKVECLFLENSKADEIMRLKDRKILEYDEILEAKSMKISEAEKHLNNNFFKIEEHIKNERNLTNKINDLEAFKTSFTSEFESKINIIHTLQQENLAIKRDNQELLEFKAQALFKFSQTILETKENEAAAATATTNNHLNSNVNNLDDLNEVLSPNQSSIYDIKKNFHRNIDSENFGLAENLKDDLQTLYNKSLKKIDALNRENDKLKMQVSGLKDEHKTEVMRLNLTVEELLKIATNNAANNHHSADEGDKGRVSGIVKNIQSKINETTIEELKKEKAGYLETIAKLKLELEAHENANNLNIDNLSDKYMRTNTYMHINSPKTPKPIKINLNGLDGIKENHDNNNNNVNKENNNANTDDRQQHVSILENDVVNVNELMEKNQNEIRERERKIEYLLQILEEKNNLIEHLRDSDKINSSNHSMEAKETLEFLQFQNENLLKEIEEKNAKVRKLNKDYNDQVAKYELLQADFLDLQEKEKEITVYTDEIELLRNKNKEYESIIEKMNKELNVKSNTLLRKEKEVNSLKADRIHNNITNKSLLESNNPNNVSNGSIIKDPKIEFLNNSLNEIRDLKDKLKQNNLNRSTRSRRGNSNDSGLNNNSLINSNNSILINTTNMNNIPRVFFEEDATNSKKKINNINNSLNSMNNSLAADAANFNLGNISKINLNDVNAINNEDGNKENNNVNQYAVNNQALFISDYASNNVNNNMNNKNNPYYSVGSNYNTNNNMLNNILTYENYSSEPNNLNTISNYQHMNTNPNYANNNYNNNFINKNYSSVPTQMQTLSLNALNCIITTETKVKKDFDFANPNIRVQEHIQPQDILQSQESWDTIRNWVANSVQKEKNKFFFRRIFKATENGFNSAVFYSKAEAKAPTLIILRNNHGKIIGGFTPIAWKTPVNSIDFLEDPSKSGFLFSVNLGKKYDIKENSIAVCHSIGCGPVFGLNDLEIVENADKKYNYFSNIGTSYNFDDVVEDFYGAAKYLVEDYEAYELLFV